MTLAKEKPGRYGGRYVALIDGSDGFTVLADDDPDLYRENEAIDLYAHVTKTAVHPLGHARRYLNEDGTVDA